MPGPAGSARKSDPAAAQPAAVTRSLPSYRQGAPSWTPPRSLRAHRSAPSRNTCARRCPWTTSSTWRCAYLSGAHELRHGAFGTPISAASEDVLAQLTPAQLFDSLAIRINGPRCWDERLTIDVVFTDAGSRYRLLLRNGVLTYTSAPQVAPADAVVRLPAAALPVLVLGGIPEDPGAAGVRIDGDASVLPRLLAALDAPDPNFAIVTP
jgi:alkyl sulfatase BDS1-like metallo-beta-lactamase superfamily hydrolase